MVRSLANRTFQLRCLLSNRERAMLRILDTKPAAFLQACPEFMVSGYVFT